MARKTLLIVCGGIEAIHGIELAKKRGLHVVVSDMDPEAPGMKAADDALVASTYDIDETVNAARHYNDTVRKIDGVMCLGADVPRTVASVAKALNLPGISEASAFLAADKLAMKQQFSKDGVPAPWFQPICDPNDLSKVVSQRKTPLVIKPADSRGSRGVQRIDASSDLTLAYDRAYRESPTNRVMVEEYLDGPQISTESIILDGIAYTPGFSDRNYEYLERYAPFFIENGGDLPSHLPPQQQSDIQELVERAAQSLGIKNGNVKGDIVVHDGKAYVIELAARLSGGYFCTLEIPMNTGVDFVGNVIKMALGEAVRPEDLKPTFSHPIAQRYKFVSPGRIVDIPNIETVRAMPGVEELMVSASPGDVVRTTENTTARVAMVIASGNDSADAAFNAQSAIDALTVILEPATVSSAIASSSPNPHPILSV